MRIAFTIIYDGLHHLKHNDFASFMVKNFDHWIVIEGHARAGGSTSWCKNPGKPQRSTDGTHEFMMDLCEQNQNVHYYSPGVYWKSKDAQVNEAILTAKLITNSCFLWQVDCDEQFEASDLTLAENELTEFIIGNLVVKMNGGFFTPPVECGLLSGTFRAELIASGEVKERVLRKQDLAECEALFLINNKKA